MASSETYRRWADGCCPCCGGFPADEPHEDYRTGEVTEAKAIGEGVVVCGECTAKDHMLIDGEPRIAEAMLLAIVQRDDAPIEALADAVAP